MTEIETEDLMLDGDVIDLWYSGAEGTEVCEGVDCSTPRDVNASRDGANGQGGPEGGGVKDHDGGNGDS